jgi:beta-N-acetylhexosaminidase
MLAAVLLLAAACGPGAVTPAPPAEIKMDIRGTITQIELASGGSSELGTIRIEGAVEPDTGYDKAVVTVTADTRIWEQSGQDRREVGFEALQVGQRVEARFAGPVAESYPVQTGASEIVILE